MPISLTCPECFKMFSLKDEFAGKKLRCPKCSAVITAPEAPAAPELPAEAASLHSAFRRDKFFMNQKVFALNESYRVLDDNNQPIMFVIRPAHHLMNFVAFLAAGAVFIVFMLVGFGGAAMLANNKQLEVLAGIVGIGGFVLAIVGAVAAAVIISPLRHIYFYADEGKKELLLHVKQDAKMQIVTATYTVVDPTDVPIGAFSKNNFLSFFRKKWRGNDAAGNPLIVATEDSMILSLLRRFLGPMFGLLRTNFILLHASDDASEMNVLGEFNRKFALTDKYVLDMSADRSHQIDRRLAVALGVLLDTGERR